jgi:uncharacterized protein involved in exopolysaccharide biosynthesis
VKHWWIVVVAAVVPALAVLVVDVVADEPFAAEALVLVLPGAASGRDNDGTAARDAVAVLGVDAIEAYVRAELAWEADPPRVHGRVIEGSNVVVVRVESDDADTVADVANAYALALVDVRGEQLRAGFGGAGAEIERRIVLVEEELAALNEELAVSADVSDPQVAALVRARDAAQLRRQELIDRRDDNAIAGAAATGDLQIIQRAVPPLARESGHLWGRWWRALLIGASFGFVVVLLIGMASAAAERRDRRRRGEQALAGSGLSSAIAAE